MMRLLALHIPFLSPVSSSRPSALKAWLVGLSSGERVLLSTACLFILLMGPGFYLLASDPRTLAGINIWVKPLKFMASLGLFALSLLWGARYLKTQIRQSLSFTLLAWMFSVPSILELLYICVQAARAEASHFNFSSPLTQMLYSLMGIGAIILTASSLWLAILLARHSRTDISPPLKTALLHGFALTFVLGAGAGLIMGAQSGHGVGGVAGDVGLPLVGWLRTGGDWRVAHFFGMHIQQFLPLLGLALSRYKFWQDNGRGVVVVWGASFLYSLFCLGLLFQAWQGVPFIPL
jgi:hypothetical protein